MGFSPSRPPRLAYVVNSLNPGGTERLVVQMSQSFCEEFDLSVVCLDDPGLWAEGLRQESIPVHCLRRKPGLDLTMALKLARFCKSQKIDLIHAHQTTPWFYAGLSRWINSAPRLLFEEHGRFFPEVGNRKRELANKLLVSPRTHCFIAVSEDVKQRLVAYEGLDPRQIQVIYNGVHPAPSLDAATRGRIRHEFGFSPDDFILGTAGRFDPIKNLPLLLHSIAKARKEISSVRGLLLGDGPVYDEVKALVENLQLTPFVAMPGHREDARRLIQCMDLFILSSFSEGTSLALLEAMSAGIPVAVTAVGGNPEIVIAGQTGWVIASDSQAQLTAAILDAALNREEASRLGDAGRRRFQENFTFDRMIESYRAIYTEMLKSRQD